MPLVISLQLLDVLSMFITFFQLLFYPVPITLLQVSRTRNTNALELKYLFSNKNASPMCELTFSPKRYKNLLRPID